jgi:peptide/nickel transport system permease protein
MHGLVRRSVFSCLVLLITSATLFVAVHRIPVSPARIALGPEATDEQMSEFDHEHGLDRPIAEQYLHWLGGALHNDWGRSYITNLSVGDELAKTLPITVEIVTVGFVFAIAASLPLGMTSAFWQGRTIDHLLRIFSVVGVSVPGFWLGLLLIAFAAVYLRWFPPGGYIPIGRGVFDHFRSIALPSFALGFYYIAILSRMTRASIVEVLGQDYVRTARAMGLSRSRIVIYVVKNGLAPVVSLAAMSYGYMFGWALIIEQVFNIAGVSRALLSAIFARDYLTVQATVMVITAIFVLANLAADMLYRLLSPRMAGGAG